MVHGFIAMNDEPLTINKMKKIKVTQVKSVIDRSERQKRTMVALGLKKMNASVEVEATPQILGMVNKVNHLVKVEELG
jgi:large subunit ribosomal protein L30